MSRVLQRLLMLAYRVAERSGVLTWSPARVAFEWSYDLYKAFIEASAVTSLQPYVREGTIVVDVGANIGFFTRRFARWTGRDGCVLAVEPEAQNFERLRAFVEAHGMDTVVVPVHAAATERNSEVRLAVDPTHPGGHYLAADGITVTSVTVDDLVRSQRSAPVSLIKIDVQGAELRVLQGATQTLGSSHPAVFVELDEAALRPQGASIAQVVDFLSSRGYRAHFVSRLGVSPPVHRERLINACLQRDYTDVLFLYDGTVR
jgi:FkbM family methyltransferase